MLGNEFKIGKKLSSLFSHVYFKVELLKNANGIKVPMYPNGNGFEFVGFNQQKCKAAYIRTIGDVRALETAQQKKYEWMQDVRIVFFVRDFTGDKDAFMLNCATLINDKSLTITNIVVNSNKLFEEEMNGSNEFTVMPNDLYFAINCTIKNHINYCCNEFLDYCSQPNQTFCIC